MIILKLIEILTPDFIFEDARGTLSQITHTPFAQTNAVFSKKGAVRGGFHYHNFSKEIFFVVSGSVKTTVRLSGQTEEYTFKNGDMFLIPEKVSHSMEYLEDTYLVAFYTQRVELSDGTKDIIAE